MPRKINTFSKQMTPEQAEREKKLGGNVGEALKKADEQYSKRGEK